MEEGARKVGVGSVLRIVSRQEEGRTCAVRLIYKLVVLVRTCREVVVEWKESAAALACQQHVSLTLALALVSTPPASRGRARQAIICAAITYAVVGGAAVVAGPVYHLPVCMPAGRQPSGQVRSP